MSVCTYPLGCEATALHDSPYCAKHHKRSADLSDGLRESRRRRAAARARKREFLDGMKRKPSGEAA